MAAGWKYPRRDEVGERPEPNGSTAKALVASATSASEKMVDPYLFM
jgi:hypothetical protein